MPDEFFDLIFKNALILDLRFKSPRKTQLAIFEGKIAYLGNRQIKAKKIIDLKGKVIIPGLINCHTHAAMNAFRGMADDLPLKDWLENNIWPAEAKNVTADFVYKWTKQACTEMAAGGTTSFCDMYFYAESVMRAAHEIGLRAVVGEPILDFKPQSLALAEQILRSKKKNLIDIAVMPHAIYSVSKANLAKAKKLADHYQTKLFIHTAESKSDKGDVQSLKKLGILDENTVLVHSVWIDSKDIETIAKRKSQVVHCPQSNMKLGSGIAPVKDMLQAGIIVGLGTDGAASNNTLDMFKEMKTAALLAKVANLDPTVLPAREVFKMATLNGAKILGLEEKIGSLKVGKSADFVILDFKKPHLHPVYDYFSHLVYASNASDVVTTYVAGKPVYQTN